MPPNGQGSIAGWALESLALAGAAPTRCEALAAAYERGYATIGGTAYVCAADGDGMAVSLIQSIFYGFGSQVIVPGHGFMLQNRGSGFVLEPGHPNGFAPAKRPFHTIIPAALLDADGRWAGVFGVTGGQFQPQGHVQVLVNLLDHGHRPQAALDAPRYRLEEDGTVSLERAAGATWSTASTGRDASVVRRTVWQPRQRLTSSPPGEPRHRAGILRGGTEPRARRRSAIIGV